MPARTGWGTFRADRARALVGACLGIAAGAWPGGAAEGPQGPGRPLEIAEILRRMEASATTYRVIPVSGRKDIDLKKSADVFWPQRQPRYPTPWVVANPRGENAVVAFPFERTANALVDEAEPLCRAGRAQEALRRYEEAVRISPEHYWAFLQMGHCYTNNGQHAKALEGYDRASAINPDDFQTFLFRGKALARLGRYPEARESYIWALVLNPRSPDTLEAIRGQAARLGVRPQEEAFVPPVLVRRESDGVAIYVGPGVGARAAWLAYGSCKAYWMGDAGHRREMTGRADHSWTTVEEKECLTALLTVYADGLAKGTLTRAPTFDRIRRILDEGLLEEFVLYEMGSRVDPHVTVKLTPPAKDRLREYVSRHVVRAR